MLVVSTWNELKYYDRHSTHSANAHVSQRTRRAHIFWQFIAFTHILTDARVSLFPFFSITHESHSKTERRYSKGYSEKWKESEPFFCCSEFVAVVSPSGIFCDITFTFTSTTTHVFFLFRSVLGTDCVTDHQIERKKIGEQFYDLWEKPINYLSFSTHTHQPNIVSIRRSSLQEFTHFVQEIVSGISWAKCVIAWCI